MFNSFQTLIQFLFPSQAGNFRLLLTEKFGLNGKNKEYLFNVFLACIP